MCQKCFSKWIQSTVAGSEHLKKNTIPQAKKEVNNKYIELVNKIAGIVKKINKFIKQSNKIAKLFESVLYSFDNEAILFEMLG